MRPACPIMALALFQHLFTLIPRGFTCSGGGMRSRDSWLHRTGIVFLALEGHVESCSSGGHLFADLWRWSSSGSGLFGYDSGQQTRGCCLCMTWRITHEGLIESGRLRLLTVPSCLVLLYHWSSSGVPQLCVLILLDCRAATQALSHPEDESSDGVQHLRVLRLNGFTTQYSESQVSLAVNIRSSPGCDAATCQVRPGHTHCPGDSQRTLWTLMLSLLPRVFVQLPGWTCARQAGPSAEVGTWDFLILSDTFMSDIWLLEIVKLLICPCVLLGLTSFNDSTGGLHPSMRRWNSHHAHGRVWWQ